MERLKIILRALVEHPSRRMIVIIATCVTTLATLWPAADEYLAQREHQDEMESSLQLAKSEIQKLPSVRRVAASTLEQVHQLRKQTVAPSETHEFRTQVAEIVRNHGCQLRRLDITGLRRRTWYQSDHPMSSIAAGDHGDKTPFELTTQVMTLSVTGDLDSVEKLLSDLRDQQRMIHARRFSLRSAASGNREVQLDLELLLFHLERNSRAAS